MVFPRENRRRTGGRRVRSTGATIFGTSRNRNRISSERWARALQLGEPVISTSALGSPSKTPLIAIAFMCRYFSGTRSWLRSMMTRRIGTLPRLFPPRRVRLTSCPASVVMILMLQPLLDRARTCRAMSVPNASNQPAIAIRIRVRRWPLTTSAAGIRQRTRSSSSRMVFFPIEGQSVIFRLPRSVTW